MSATTAYFEQSVGTGDTVNYDAYKRLMTHLEGSGTPAGSVTPEFVGQEYFDTAGADFYRATGPLAANWKQITA